MSAPGQKFPPPPSWLYFVAYEDQAGAGNSYVNLPGKITTPGHVKALEAYVRDEVGQEAIVVTAWELLRVDGLDFHGMPVDPDYTARCAYEAWIGPVPGATPWTNLPPASQDTWARVAITVQQALGGLPAAF